MLRQHESSPRPALCVVGICANPEMLKEGFMLCDLACFLL